MATNSVIMTNIDAYSAYVQSYHNELIKSAFRGFTSAQHLTAYENVKGRKTFTLDGQADVLKVFNGTYAAAGGNTPTVKHLNTSRFAAEMNLVPSEFEDSYLGQFIEEGQQTDIGSNPFFRQFIDKFLLRIQYQQERAVWNSDVDLSTYLGEFDGFGEIIADAVTATTLTAVATGVLDAAAIEADLESMYDALADELKDDPSRPLKFYMPRKWKDTYMRAFQDSVGKYSGTDQMVATLNGTRAELVAVDALSGTNKVCLTTQDNMVIGYDAAADATNINIIKDHYHVEHSVVLKLGVQILRAADDYMVVNDQW